MKTKLEIARDWLPRYTGTPLEGLGEHILLTNFFNYLVKISQRFDTPILGEGGPMQTVTNTDGLTLVNFGMGSANAATILDLLVAYKPRGVLLSRQVRGTEAIRRDWPLHPPDYRDPWRGHQQRLHAPGSSGPAVCSSSTSSSRTRFCSTVRSTGPG